MENEAIRVLVVDDDPVDIAIVRRYLEETSEWNIEIIALENPDRALEELDRQKVDVAFLDHFMGNTTGIDILGKIQAAGISTPIIMLTGTGDEELAVRAIKLGAADYLVKGSMSADSLKRAIINAVEKGNLRGQIEEQNQLLEEKVRELETALDHVKQLQGIIPICTFCKQIRDDSSFWSSVEEYISEHSEAEFSHSICPECMKKEYPEYIL